MTGLWNQLARLFEAKDPSRLKDDLHRYMTRRYGEHAADEAMALLQKLPPKEFARQIEAQYFDSRINAIAQELAKTVEPTQARGPGRPPKDDRPPTQPGQSTDKGSGNAEPIPQRPDRTGTQAKGIEPLIRPGSKFGQDPGTAGQNAPKPQPSQQEIPSTLPQDLERLRAHRDKIKADPRKAAELQAVDDKIAKLARAGESGLMDKQRQVDYITLTYGTRTGDRMAARLKVPTSAQRGGALKVEPTADSSGEWAKKPSVMSPDAIAKHMSQDPEDRPDGSTWDPGAGGGVSSLKKASSTSTQGDVGGPGTRGTGGPVAGTQKPMVRDPKTGEMVVRPGDFPWQRWKPAGVSRKVQTARPDAATGNTVRGSRYTNPAQEGEPLFWDPDGRDWVTKSQALAARAQKKATGG